MKIRHSLVAFVIILSTCLTALADRTLSSSEISQIFQQLTSQPKHTWIPAGTIEATHSEYKAAKVTDVNQIAASIAQKVAAYQNNTQKIELSDEQQTLAASAIPFNTRYELANEYTMDSDVTVRYDGSRFYWEINVTSRNDSVKLDTTLRSNYMTNHFNLSGNARRMFVWDGAKYTKYFLPANQASVDTTGNVPHAVNGPLTAGVIPWGYGVYSLANLTAATATAVEIASDANQTQINMTLTRSNGMEIALQLDPSKNYAVTSCVTTQNNSIIMQQYSGYQQVGSNWVPSNISVEKYDAAASKLLARDQWTITSVSGDAPAADAFAINFKPAAMIEYTNIAKPAICRMKETNTGNCATVALKYAASRLGKDVSDKQLTSLVSGQNNTTDMLAMKNFVKNIGLYCSAVNTDIQTLKGLKNCQVILHESAKNHFVMLNEAGKDTTILDPIHNKIFQTPDLSKCTALVVSNQPVRGIGPAICDAQLQTITGAIGFTCSKLLQQENTSYCADPEGGICGGGYAYFYERYGCAMAASGSCSSSNLDRYDSTPCIYNFDGDSCVGTGEWTSYYMKACM